MKERRRLAKRIVKAVQPVLEAAVRAEAEISDKPVDKELKQFEHLIDAALEAGKAGNDTVSVSLGDGSVGEREAEPDVEMAEANGNGTIEVKGNSNETNGDQEKNRPTDVEMQDADAPGEDENTIIAATPGNGTIDTGPTTRSNKSSPSKANGTKSANTPPDTNGHVQAPEIAPPAPPTPPVSNGDTNTDADILTNGGIPWYVKDFQPEGTSLVPGKDAMSSFSEDLSEMDDDDLKGLGADVAAGETAGTTITATPAKPKKGKAKKKGKSRR